ncbi:MAG: NosD domain-containing protein [Candidatus Bathycorpusculaceae bacterium]
MKSKAIIGIMLALLFFSMLRLVNDIQPIEAVDETIYIKADGSIVPSSANITTYDNVTYTFNGTNYYPIVVERSNIIIDGNGFAVQGKKDYPSAGVSLQDINNVTITNVTVKDSYYGIKLNLTSNIKILGNLLNNTSRGLYFLHSFNDTAYGNNITNNLGGVEIWDSHNATISGNTLSKNKGIKFTETT